MSDSDDIIKNLDLEEPAYVRITSGGMICWFFHRWEYGEALIEHCFIMQDRVCRRCGRTERSLGRGFQPHPNKENP